MKNFIRLKKSNPAGSRSEFVSKYLYRNFALNAADGVLYFTGMTFMSMENILPNLFRSLGANNLVISIIPLVFNFAIFFPAVFNPLLTGKHSRQKPFILFFGFFQRLPWLLIGLSIFFFHFLPGPLLLSLFILLLLCGFIFGGINIPSWFDLVARVTPISWRGTLMAVRHTLAYSIGIAAGILVSLIFKSFSYPLNFFLLFSIGASFLFLSEITIALVKEPEIIVDKSINQSAAFYFKRYREIIKNNRAFVLSLTAMAIYLSLHSATAFFSVYLLEKFSLDDYYLGIFATILSFAHIISNPVLGIIGDRFGHKINFIIGALFMGLGFLLLLSPWFFLALPAFFCSALSQSARFLSLNNMVIEYCSPEDRPLFLAVRGLFLGPAAFSSLLLGLMADIFSYQILFIFCAVLSLALVVFFIIMIKEPRKYFAHLQKEH